MSKSNAPARPSQVTLAGGVAVVGSALLVLTLFDSMSELRSIEMRESIEQFLSSAPGSGLGLTVAGTVEIIRGLMLVTGAAAAVTMVLGIYVLQRNKGARLGFTIAAMAIMVTAPVSGGFLPVLIAFAALMLWTGPARDWFSGTTGSAARERATSEPDKSDMFSSSENPSQPSVKPPAESAAPHEWPPAPSPDAPADHAPPPPTQGFGMPNPTHGEQPQPSGQGDEGDAPHGQPQPYGQPQASGPPQPYAQPQASGPPQSYGPPQASGPPQPNHAWAPPAYGQQPQQYYGTDPAYPQQSRDKRPTTVTVAVWLTWVFAGLTLVVYGFVVIALLFAKDQFLDAVRGEPEFQQLNVSTDDLVSALWVMSAVVIFWCLAAIVLAGFAFRRFNWARIMLAVSAAMAALFSVAALQFGLLHMLVSGATVALLFLGGANQWYSRGPHHGYPPYPGRGNPYAGPPGNPQQGERYSGPPARDDEREPPKNVW